MMETYRKWGRVARWEHGVLIHVEEAGQSYDSQEHFRAAPLDPRDPPDTLPDPDSDAVVRAASAIAELIEPPMAIERMILSDGVALHQCGSNQWQERTQRLHLSLARPPYRLLIDRAGLEIDVRLVAAFAAMIPRSEEPLERLVLAPPVTAAYLSTRPAALAMHQAPGGRDGKGKPVLQVAVTGEKPPNWYRPGYRVRPIRSWFHLRVSPFGVMDETVPRAVALLSSPSGGRIHVLCVKEGRATPRWITPGRILAAGAASEWYPYGAGCWGSDMLLESAG